MAEGDRYYRKIIRIEAAQSPNVRLAQAQIAAGLSVTGEVLVPGVLTYDEYLKRLGSWDDIRKTVSLFARWYRGKEVLLYPPQWIDWAARLEMVLRCRNAPAEAIGIDPAEGGDKTSMAAVNRYGLKELVSRKTPNTDDAYKEAVAFMRRHNVLGENVVWDRGGGGKQHADRMRALRSQEFPFGIQCRTVAFGESLVPDPKRGMRVFAEKIDQREDRYAFVNRRAEMAYTLRLLLDPTAVGTDLYLSLGARHLFHPDAVNAGKYQDPRQVFNGSTTIAKYPYLGFAIPSSSDPGDPLTELRKEMSPIPLLHDPEGRVRLPAKNKRGETSTERTLVEMIGHSPDEWDSVLLGVHGMVNRASRQVAGGVG